MKKIIRYAGAIANSISALVLSMSFVLPAPWSLYFLYVGAMALAGGLTNWLAVYMIFERVPGLYGSGVIVRRFDAIRLQLRGMILREFFDREHIDAVLNRFYDDQKIQSLLRQEIQHIPWNSLFDRLGDSISQSSLGTMLSLIGGKNILEPMREPFIAALQKALEKHVETIDFSSLVPSSSEIERLITQLIDERLYQMTPAQTKALVDQMIRAHLTWVVVWGAVFGALLGLPLAFLLPKIS
jgi:uncharacterized membrane-anchored protein YjiN (DUF445 family)